MFFIILYNKNSLFAGLYALVSGRHSNKTHLERREYEYFRKDQNKARFSSNMGEISHYEYDADLLHADRIHQTEAESDL